MKRFLVFMLAGAMLFTTPVIAAEDGDYDYDYDYDYDEDYDGEDGDEEGDGDENESDSDKNDGNGENKKGKKSPTAGDINPSTSGSVQAAPSTQAVEASSIPAYIIQAAAAEGKTVGEYMNNAVVTVPGLDYAVPIGQGGHVIINGAPSNQVFSVLKPALSNVNSAKAFAVSLGGKVLTVVRINASVSGFQTARVNFYMKGVKAGQNIKVFQIVNGQWVEVDVAEIRADHVVVDMTSLGTLAFIEMPN